MNLVQKVRRDLHDKLSTFKLLQRVIAIVCIAIPGLLRLADTGNNGFRKSVSNYVYMCKSYIFGMLLCMAAMLFIFNGAVYFKNQSKLYIQKSGKWYNVILGVSLLGVILFPHREFKTVHLVFAIIFFVGNAVVTGIFHTKRNRVMSITLAILTVASFVVYALKLIPLFWAEWLSLTVIGVHLFLESRTAAYRHSADAATTQPQ